MEGVPKAKAGRSVGRKIPPNKISEYPVCLHSGICYIWQCSRDKKASQFRYIGLLQARGHENPWNVSTAMKKECLNSNLWLSTTWRLKLRWTQVQSRRIYSGRKSANFLGALSWKALIPVLVLWKWMVDTRAHLFSFLFVLEKWTSTPQRIRQREGIRWEKSWFPKIQRCTS